MTLNSESPSTSNRDWFFPSQSFNVPRSPARRFSSPYPRTTTSFQNSSSNFTSPLAVPRTLRRRISHRHRIQNSAGATTDEIGGKSNDAVLIQSEECPSSGNKTTTSAHKKCTDFVRWRMACVIAMVVMCFTSLLHKNFSLQFQVSDLQDEFSTLNARLRHCNISDSIGIIDSTPEHNSSSASLKNTALILSLMMFSLPLVFIKYMEYISNLRRPLDNTTEELSLNKRLAYRVDVFLSFHPYAKPLTLLIATLLLISLGGLALFGVTDDSIANCLWLSWTYVANSGNHTNSEGIGPRLVSVSVSFGGMLIFAMMLGLVSDAISEKFDSLRKGRSEVVEQNHTLILGWSDKLGSLLNQLAIANESLGGGTVVVMAERDKEEMELDIAKMEFDFRGTSVICRSGSPLILADLKKVSVSKARAIVVLAEDGNADQSDARALRTVLSLTGVKEGLRGHIVVELSDLDNEVLVKLVGGDLVETVVAHDVIGRLMIQCARQPGLAQIWEDILGFENCEFYIKKWPQFHGMQFEEVLISFPDAIPCGIKVASSGGKIILNPDDSYLLQEGDEVLVIAEDDDSYAPAPLPMVQGGNLPKNLIIPKTTERILFCGWRRDMEDMILILILADESVEDSAIQADSRSLATLLLIRDIQAKRLPYREAMASKIHRGSSSQGSWREEMQQASDKSVIISEILDPRTKNLLSMSKISDYVLSNELVSMALAMVAEDRQINDVLEELFAEEGNELQIRGADLYLCEGEELSFYEVLLRARQRREIVIGYRLANAEKAIINPPAKTERRRWSVKDVFVIIADKE
ncbi:PREDICTED: probable ion channel CASTOR isoform X3 [Nicotiana attenuata]|uniref:probable ion channel CASTOR isoform X3 n=1 Tax=Nicotiana attenuata TaxID=49451 RepID=UPI000904A89A|nr:PREDICTED: probable ion channel CASTOR isoform X3 [Nicotiana attenuata]